MARSLSFCAVRHFRFKHLHSSHARRAGFLPLNASVALAMHGQAAVRTTTMSFLNRETTPGERERAAQRLGSLVVTSTPDDRIVPAALAAPAAVEPEVEKPEPSAVDDATAGVANAPSTTPPAVSPPTEPARRSVDGDVDLRVAVAEMLAQARGEQSRWTAQIEEAKVRIEELQRRRDDASALVESLEGYLQRVAGTSAEA